MEIFDFNVHLPVISGNTNSTICHEGTMEAEDLLEAYGIHHTEFEKNFTSANFMLFNTRISDDKKLKLFLDKTAGEFPGSSFTGLLDFRDKDRDEILYKMSSLEIRFVKFHSYIQKIGNDDFRHIIDSCKTAAGYGMALCFDASYGTTGMYKYDNLALVACVADRISDAPIVVLHSGGARVLQALLLADEKHNIFLETSYSLPYYEASSIEKDIAFSYKKVGAERVLYGSDFPYMPFGKSTEAVCCFFEKYSFSSSDIEKIMYKNAYALANA